MSSWKVPTPEMSLSCIAQVKVGWTAPLRRAPPIGETRIGFGS
jgi:hypothetical protein